MLGFLFFCAIELLGVQGETLRVRTYFDANNVRAGESLVLTIDFIGDVNFDALHPPALARAVDRDDWDIADYSAKTKTYRDARCVTYRVLPKRTGLLWFPALEFTYRSNTGSPRLVKSNGVPVHVKEGLASAGDPGGISPTGSAAEMEQEEHLPEPPELIRTADLTGDALFAWRKACHGTNADAFAGFDFPAAKMNEATCAIRAGDWARAMKIYRGLEWRVGQTPEIERGIVAALARRFDNPQVELPVARQVFRPVLRFDWRGRVGILLGAVTLLVLVFWGLGRLLRALAVLTIACLLVWPARADIFQQMEAQMRRLQQQMNASFPFGGGLFEQEEQPAVRITASLAMDRTGVRVGEPFAFIVSLEAPRNVSIGQISMTPSERFGLTVTGQAANLADIPAKNPSNVIKRLSVPVRYDVPLKTALSFKIQGMVTSRGTRRGGYFSSTFQNFACDTRPIRLEIKPLATAGQPKDFAGIVSTGLRLHETCDILRVETNDVVTISYRLLPNGYVPADYLLPDAAFEWNRQTDRDGHPTEIVYRRFWVANGAEKTPEISVSYYDPRTKSYRRVTTGGTKILYRSPK